MAKKYNVASSVTWRELLSLLRWRIRVLYREAIWFVRCYESDFDHNFPDFVDYHRYSACSAAERVFSLVCLLNELRVFLCYKPLSPNDLGIQDLYSFYEANYEEYKRVGFVSIPVKNLYVYPDM